MDQVEPTPICSQIIKKITKKRSQKKDHKKKITKKDHKKRSQKKDHKKDHKKRSQKKDHKKDHKIVLIKYNGIFFLNIHTIFAAKPVNYFLNNSNCEKYRFFIIFLCDKYVSILYFYLN